MNFLFIIFILKFTMNSHSNLKNIPCEIKEEIILDLSFPDLLRYISTSKEFSKPLSYLFWRKKAKKDLDIELLNYKDYLKRKYKQLMLGIKEKTALLKVLERVNMDIKNKNNIIFESLHLKLIISLRKYLKARYDINGPIRIKRPRNGGVKYITVSDFNTTISFRGWSNGNNYEVHINGDYLHEEVSTSQQARLVGRLSGEIDQNGAIFIVMTAFIEMYQCE